MKVSKEEIKMLCMWALIGTVLVTILFIYKVKEKENNQKTYNEEYQIVKDYNRFYTALGAINKYYSFVSSKNEESVLHIISDKEKKKDGFDPKLIINEYKESVSYDADIMYYKEIDEGIYSYYVKGSVISSNTDKKIKDAYLEVILDGNTFHFSITPLDENEFGGVING